VAAPENLADQLEAVAEAVDELIGDCLRGALDADDPTEGDARSRVLGRARRSVLKAGELLRSLSVEDA
jgi:hypothetical protein